MRRALVLLAVLALAMNGASAGHGLINSFAGIDWLPDPGVTPDRYAWLGDRWAERARLWRAGGAAPRLALLLGDLRERLAELEAMVQAGHARAADLAGEHYREQLAAAVRSAHSGAPAERATLLGRLADALLEHQYILSTDYPDLPRAARAAVTPVMAAAGAAYGAVVQGLGRAERERRFFREEEVRWSWEMALAGEAQGL
jgi:hypothetical protein